MNAIRVAVSDLLKKMKENRDVHRAIFLEAQKGYRELVIAELDSMRTDARAGRKIRRSVTLTEPMDQTKDYDRVISMLEMTTESCILLEERDFRAYVLDEWTWKSQFNVSNALYSKTLEVSLAGDQS